MGRPDVKAGGPCPGPGSTQPCVCLLPQCERFVEEHAPRLQTLVSSGWDAHMACQVCSPLPAGSRTWFQSPESSPTPAPVHSSQCRAAPGVPAHMLPGPNPPPWEVSSYKDKAVSEKSRKSHRRMKREEYGEHSWLLQRHLCA